MLVGSTLHEYDLKTSSCFRVMHKEIVFEIVGVSKTGSGSKTEKIFKGRGLGGLKDIWRVCV